MKKVFIVAGEASGDELGAWYIKKYLAAENVYREGIGGTHLEAAGVKLYERLEKLNITGIVEVIKHVWPLMRFLKKVAHYLQQEQFDQVILIDFPGFNLRLARYLKQHTTISIVYLSPPQLWAWGERRITSLKRYTDRIIVLYPFEVAWYKERGVHVEWFGSPHYERVKPFFAAIPSKKPVIALLPGSRTHELDRLLPLMIEAARILHTDYPFISFLLPISETCSYEEMSTRLTELKALPPEFPIKLVQGKEKVLEELSSCCVALTKPGTITLELALLKIPALVLYKTSWLTYIIARLLVKVNSMALPNFFFEQPVYKELIQFSCHPEAIASYLEELFLEYERKSVNYQATQSKLQNIRIMLQS